MEALVPPLEEVQEAILSLVKTHRECPTAEKEEEFDIAGGVQEALTAMRRAEKGLRERLRTLQVAQQYGWEIAAKVEKQLTGKESDPVLAAAMKVVADRKRAKEKEESKETWKKSRRGLEPFRGGDRGSRYRYDAYRSPYMGFYKNQQAWNGNIYPGPSNWYPGPQSAYVGLASSQVPPIPMQLPTSAPPQSVPASTMSSRTSGPIRCFICNEEGHRVSSCPQNPKNK